MKCVQLLSFPMIDSRNEFEWVSSVPFECVTLLTNKRLEPIEETTFLTSVYNAYYIYTVRHTIVWDRLLNQTVSHGIFGIKRDGRFYAMGWLLARQRGLAQWGEKVSCHWDSYLGGFCLYLLFACSFRWLKWPIQIAALWIVYIQMNQQPWYPWIVLYTIMLRNSRSNRIFGTRYIRQQVDWIKLEWMKLDVARVGREAGSGCKY